MYAEAIAARARREWSRLPRKLRGVQPPADDARAAIHYLTNLLIDSGDVRARIHLDERLSGRVKQEFGIGGIDDAPPIGLTLRLPPGVYQTQFADGAPVAGVGLPAPGTVPRPAAAAERKRR